MRSNNEWTLEVNASILHRRRDSKPLISKLQHLGIDLLRVKKWEDEVGAHFTEMRRQIYKTFTKAKNGAGIISDLRLIEDKIKGLNAKNGAGINSDPRLVEDKIKEFNAKNGADINSDPRLVEDKIKELSAKNEADINSYLRLVEEKIEELNAKSKADINRDRPEDSRENAKIKKRPLIYWWIGEGLIAATDDKTAEEEGGKYLSGINRSPVHRAIPRNTKPRCQCVQNASLASSLGNIFGPKGSNSLNSIPQEHHLIVPPDVDVNAWFWELKKVEVLQLGAWHCSPRHHIEVEKEEVLRGLEGSKALEIS
ncbi:LEUCINE-RICH REPEAT (LRR) FAMILY PROTEIN-RELATED [Salix koriyanagi]|uniref:LEUCINE-RICH REPEAT (LRR) FAMILY PROTEIN-RELATED n=1 Tax=Salix koriyanagi TaxID=2511006 RepID=A0A9Q0W9P6_9ROSI|nr:LEUCINE-RICH REPEAT (LRR) FAMILY PROTEIN-RELATED [Salix koriyanagi]